MKRALAIAQLAVYITLALLLSVSSLLVIRARKAVINADEQVQGVAQDVHHVAQHADRVLTEAGLTAKAAREISEYQKKATPVTQAKLNAAIDQFSELVRATDASLNDQAHGALPAIEAAVEKNSGAMNNAILHFDSGSSEALRVGAVALEALDRRIDDPAITRSLENIAAMSESGKETLGHVNAATGDISQAVHRMTRPAAWWRTMLNQIAGGASKLRVWF